MSLNYGKRVVAALAATLNADYETVEDAAVAALTKMEQIFATRAKWVVVGQLSSTREKPVIPPSDPEAIRISLGWYSTESEAREAAERLWSSTATGETFRVWCLPVHHGTPGEFHKMRKQHYNQIEAKARQRRSNSMRAFIEERSKRPEEMVREK